MTLWEQLVCPLLLSETSVTNPTILRRLVLPRSVLRGGEVVLVVVVTSVDPWSTGIKTVLIKTLLG